MDKMRCNITTHLFYSCYNREEENKRKRSNAANVLGGASSSAKMSGDFYTGGGKRTSRHNVDVRNFLADSFMNRGGGGPSSYHSGKWPGGFGNDLFGNDNNLYDESPCRYSRRRSKKRRYPPPYDLSSDSSYSLQDMKKSRRKSDSKNKKSNDNDNSIVQID